ncbi:MAG TPA: hypothetical protein DDZ51_17575 [Planctomycetaceae bacterium]|nr:hypothetical protein [Planctomycetaceae bacterium]
MLGPLFIYPLFVASCIAGVFRPFYGLLGFYAFVFLEPEWNWRWSIPRDWNFQKYIGACLLAGVLLHGFRGNRFSGWLGWAVVALLSFLALAWVSASQTIDARFTAFYMDIITKVIIIAVVTIRIVDTREKALALLWVIVVGQGYNALRINEQYFQDGYSLYSYMRSWGNKGDNNLYSIFTIPAMGGAFGLALHSTKLWHKGLAGFIAVLQLHQMMLMESRGGMLGGLLMAALAIWLMPKTSFNIRAVIAGLIVGSVLAGPPVIEEFMSSFKKEGERDSSAESRYELWSAGFRITADYPLLGVGPYAGQMLVPRYSENYRDLSNKGLHNLIFEISTGCGVPALLCYLAFLLIPWWNVFWTYRRDRAELDPATSACLLAVAVGIPGYLFSSMFSSGALLESSYVLVACGSAALHLWQQQERAPIDVEAEQQGDEGRWEHSEAT